MDADQIIVLDEGKIVGKGTHKELLQDCAVYKEIAMSQLSEEELGNVTLHPMSAAAGTGGVLA